MHPVFSSPFFVSPPKVHLTEEVASMWTHLSSVAEENKLFDGSGNVGVCENPQAGAGDGAVANAGKKPVCVKAA